MIISDTIHQLVLQETQSPGIHSAWATASRWHGNAGLCLWRIGRSKYGVIHIDIISIGIHLMDVLDYSIDRNILYHTPGSPVYKILSNKYNTGNLIHEILWKVCPFYPLMIPQNVAISVECMQEYAIMMSCHGRHDMSHMHSYPTSSAQRAERTLNSWFILLVRVQTIEIIIMSCMYGLS